MLMSRGSLLFKNIANNIVAKKPVCHVVSTRKMSGGGFWYRDIPAAPRGDLIAAEIAGGILWWWMLWNTWHGWEHIVGEYEYPDPSKWTDEELGILPED